MIIMLIIDIIVIIRSRPPTLENSAWVLWRTRSGELCRGAPRASNDKFDSKIDVGTIANNHMIIMIVTIIIFTIIVITKSIIIIIIVIIIVIIIIIIVIIIIIIIIIGPGLGPPPAQVQGPAPAFRSERATAVSPPKKRWQRKANASCCANARNALFSARLSCPVLSCPVLNNSACTQQQMTMTMTMTTTTTTTPTMRKANDNRRGADRFPRSAACGKTGRGWVWRWCVWDRSRVHSLYGDFTTISPTMISKLNIEFQQQHWISPLWQDIFLNDQGFFWNHNWWSCSQIPVQIVVQWVHMGI